MNDLELYGIKNPNLTTLHFDNEEDWLELRRKGIGGSDIGAIMGLNEYSSPLKVYKQKVEGFKEDLSDNANIKKGKVLEDLILKEYVRPKMESLGYTVAKPNFMIVNNQYPYLRANVDGIGFSYTDDQNPIIIEIKWVSEFGEVKWNKEEYLGIPPSYYAQIQLYLLVTGCEKAYLCALFDKKWEMHYYEIPKDEAFCALLLKQALAFYSYNMLMKIPPKTDYTLDKDTVVETVTKNPEPTTPDFEMTDVVNKYYEINTKINELDKQKKELATELYNMYAKGHYPENCDLKFKISVVTSKNFDSTSFRKDYPELFEKYVKQSTSPRLTIKK